jgi:uncharacterized membrane protein YdjX (TVP38/TMEM64 family)
MNPTSLWFFCVVLFLDGAIFSPATTPTLLYFAKHHSPWLVAVAGSVSSGLGSALQYAVLRWMLLARHRWMKRFAPSRVKLEAAIGRYPSTSFITILAARATPMPDAPVKLVAALVEYPVGLYFLATLLGALPYYYVIALAGSRFRFPTWVLIVAILAIGLFVLVDWLRRRRRKKA